VVFSFMLAAGVEDVKCNLPGAGCRRELDRGEP
jgi:hypothetical protein